MEYQLIKTIHLKIFQNNFLSLTSSPLFIHNYSCINNLNNISKRSLTTTNFNVRISPQKISKLSYSVSSSNSIHKNRDNKTLEVQPLKKINSSILELTRLLNNFNPNFHKVVPFYLDTVKIGALSKEVFPELKKYNKTFKRKLRPFSINSQRVTFSDYIDTFDKRSQVINDLLCYWRDNNTFNCLKGWRNEVFPVFDGNHEIAFRIERSGIALFGFRAYGCHINGYIEDPDTHEIKMWIAQRSLTKQTFPGKLDNIVAGGIAFPYNPTETAIKECLEEASMPNEISNQVFIKLFLFFFFLKKKKKKKRKEIKNKI